MGNFYRISKPTDVAYEPAYGSESSMYQPIPVVFPGLESPIVALHLREKVFSSRKSRSVFLVGEGLSRESPCAIAQFRHRRLLSSAHALTQYRFVPRFLFKPMRLLTRRRLC